MDLPALIQHYGYLVVFLGAFLEGETVLVLAGYAAHRGYLSLPAVIGVAFVGAVLGDQLYFFLGRHWGTPLVARLPHWRARADSVRNLLKRHDASFILSLRFLYGLRTVGAVVIGMSGIPPTRFVVFNVFGAMIWSMAVGVSGYLVGSMAALLIRDLSRYEEWVAAVIAAVSLTLWYVRRRFGAGRNGM